MKFRIICALCVCIALQVANLRAAFSEQRELKTESAEKIDAILLLDSSGSMLSTDPQRLRDEGAKLFIQFLKPGDRVAVIAFSGEASLVQPLINYDHKLDSSIAEKIAKIDNSGENTDLLAGVKLAQDVLKKDPRSDANQVIILLSDGKMDPAPANGTAKSRTDEMFNVYLPELKSQNIKIHTLSFSDQADKDALSQISAGTEGLSMYTPDADKIHQSFTNLFFAVKKPQVLPLTSKGFKVDSDVEEATFYINREGNEDISAESPSGKKITPAVPGENVRWFRGQKFDVITVTKPEAGDWKVAGLVSQDGFATLLTNLKLVTDWPGSVAVNEPTLLQARLYEDDKPVVLPEMTGAVNYAFQIVATDKVAEPIIKEFLKDDGQNGDKIANDGIFSALINLKESGDYTLKVVAHAPTFDRYQQIPFRVKPRIISIKVESREGHAAKSSDHSDSHHEDTHQDPHHADSHAEGHASHAETSAQEHSNETGAATEDYFVAYLSPETRDLKGMEIKLLALDKERNRFTLKFEATTDPLVYEIPASMLPEAGLYEIEASLTATAKKKTIKANSEKIEYLLKPSEKAAVEIVKVEKHSEEKKPVEKDVPESPLLAIIIATIGNLAAAAAVFFLFKKLGSSSKITLPVFEPIEQTRSAVSSLRSKVSVTTFNLEDPIFTGKARSEAVPAAPAEAKPAESAPAESAANAAEDTAGDESSSQSEATAEPQGEGQEEA